ncbi:WXG100 family type VII secretion target [Streptosporangium roseum]|uniref:WXG100 family type VII secretion target n=1 Tax=Streptosporangium roseum TaxID=2001 RepID=UPI00332DFD27
MGSESKVLIIRSSAAVPQADGVTQTKDQIKELLRNTSPTSIDDAGFAYGNAAGTVDLVCGVLQSVAGELAKVWGGETAVEVQKALQMLHATGTELVSKMEQMSTTLRLYGGTYLPQAIEKIDKLESQDTTSAVPPSANPGMSPAAADVEAAAAAKKAADEAARKVLRELNEKIVELYNTQVPPHVSYELPTVSLPGGPSSYTKTQYPEGGSPYQGGSAGSGNGSAGSGTGGSSWSPGSGTGNGGSGGSGPGGSGPGGSGPGGPGSDGPGSDGSGPKGSDPADPGSKGTDPGGSGSGGTGSPGSGDGAPGAEGGNGNGQSPADGANGSGHGKDPDGTAPAVIGGNEDAPRHDPRSTETSSLTPQPVTTIAPPNNVVPTTVAPPTISVGPTNAVSPVLGVGGPGAGAGSLGVGGAGSAALARGTIGNGMMPMMPMGGMGGMGQEGGEEHERSVYLPEKGPWESEHDVTSSCIR